MDTFDPNQETLLGKGSSHDASLILLTWLQSMKEVPRSSAAKSQQSHKLFYSYLQECESKIVFVENEVFWLEHYVWDK